MEPITLLPAAPGRKSPGETGPRNIYDLTLDELAATLEGWGQPRYRAKQVMHWLYKELATRFEAMTNLPLDLRRRLGEAFRIGSAQVVAQSISRDQDTRKVLFQFADGNTVETVLMLYYDRATVCVSSQVGCAMGCVFCATGQMGFTRNLSTGEILEQVLVFSRWLREHPYEPPARPAPGGGWQVAPDEVEAQANPQHAPLTAVTNVVFMGMGEPLLNYDHLWEAIRQLNSPDGLGWGRGG